MLDTTAIDAWLEQYRHAWKTDAEEDVAWLFTGDVRYFTAPYREPLTGKDAVVEYWLGEKESGIPWDFDYEVLAREGDLFVVRATTRYPEGTGDADGPEVFRNLWLVTLAEDGRAREFIEYYMLEA